MLDGSPRQANVGDKGRRGADTVEGISVATKPFLSPGGMKSGRWSGMMPRAVCNYARMVRREKGPTLPLRHGKSVEKDGEEFGWIVLTMAARGGKVSRRTCTYGV